jgi:lipopolysaccharide transport system permease protein
MTGAMILVSVGVVVILLVSGAFYFRKMEQYYADVV